jgi:hypothetical protein
MSVSAPAMAEEHDPIFDDIVGRMCFRDLLRDSGWSLNGPWERAAFVIQQSDGSIACQGWPSKHSYLTESFNGLVPLHTIAIVHTHPVDFPRPSQHDKDEATRLGIPIYVLTIRGVYKAVPGVRNAAILANEQTWYRNVPNKAPSGLASVSP